MFFYEIKVSIENEDDELLFVNPSKIILAKPIKTVDKTDSNHKKVDSTTKVATNTSTELVTSSFSIDESADMKTLLVQLTKELKSQREEYENSRKQQQATTNYLKNQLDVTVKQLQKISQTSSSSALINGDTSIQQLSTSIILQIMPQLDKLLKDEINKSMQLQLSTRFLDPIREQISRDLAEKLKSVDNLLKDSVSKLFKSKTTLDSISQSVVNSMQVQIIKLFVSKKRKSLFGNISHLIYYFVKCIQF